MNKENKLDKATEEQLEYALKAIQEEVKNDPEARKLFEQNPGAMLQKHGVNTKKLPAEVLEGIAGGKSYSGGYRRRPGGISWRIPK